MNTNNKSQFLIIFLVIFIDLLGFGLIIPIIPFYLEDMVTDVAQIGKIIATMITAYSLMQFIFAPIWGRISDRIGRRPVILFSLAGTAVTHLAFALSTEVWMLYASRILTGILAATISTATAYISDVTDEESRTKGMGLVGAAFGLGFILGPATGGILSHFGGYRIPLFGASILSTAAFIFAYFRLKESLDFKTVKQGDYRRYNLKTIFQALTNPRLGLLYTIFFLVTLSFANMETIFALFTERRFGFDSLETGYAFAFIGGCSALMQGVFIGRLSKRFGEKKLITIATLFLAISFILIGTFEYLIPFLLFTGIMAMSLGMHNPSVLSLVSKNARKGESGSVLGLNQSFSALGRVLGPLWAGFFFDYIGPEFPLISAGILIFIAFLLSFGLYRNKELQEKTS
ncbi:MAG: MFS transporter [Calditrichae bacterium]|nr:MFS transporter [Calditrichota bacterium]MCB9057610.1 MFS transporter [Calditrichia bacterium]